MLHLLKEFAHSKNSVTQHSMTLECFHSRITPSLVWFLRRRRSTGLLIHPWKQTQVFRFSLSIPGFHFDSMIIQHLFKICFWNDSVPWATCFWKYVINYDKTPEKFKILNCTCDLYVGNEKFPQSDCCQQWTNSGSIHSGFSTRCF